MTGFAEAPTWWRTLGVPPMAGFLTAVRDLLDNHVVGAISTRDLAELLWPECNVRGDAQVKARQKMYKVLMRFARTTLKDYCEQSGEPNKFGGIPYRWHARRSVIYGHSHNTAALSEDNALKLAALGVLKAWDRFEAANFSYAAVNVSMPEAIDELREAVK